MLNITKTLVKKGYVPYRKVFNKKTRKFSYIQEKSFNHVYHRANFNTMKNGGIDVRFVKNRNFKNEIVFGLGRKESQPSILYPNNFNVFDL